MNEIDFTLRRKSNFLFQSQPRRKEGTTINYATAFREQAKVFRCYHWASLRHGLGRALEIVQHKGFTRECIHQSEKQFLSQSHGQIDP